MSVLMFRFCAIIPLPVLSFLSSLSSSYTPLPHPHSFPTRRSSDLARGAPRPRGAPRRAARRSGADRLRSLRGARAARRDRKSTRLNSSHLGISYAVFCLKKKKKEKQTNKCEKQLHSMQEQLVLRYH